MVSFSKDGLANLVQPAFVSDQLVPLEGLMIFLLNLNVPDGGGKIAMALACGIAAGDDLLCHVRSAKKQQVVRGRNEELGGTGVTLTAGTSNELSIDAAAAALRRFQHHAGRAVPEVSRDSLPAVSRNMAARSRNSASSRLRSSSARWRTR